MKIYWIPLKIYMSKYLYVNVGSYILVYVLCLPKLLVFSSLFFSFFFFGGGGVGIGLVTGYWFNWSNRQVRSDFYNHTFSLVLKLPKTIYFNNYLANNLPKNYWTPKCTLKVTIFNL